MGGILGGLAAAGGILLYAITFHPSEVQGEPIRCAAGAPLLTPGAKLKILSWNIQYLAGKGYVFFYDLPHDAGPDERPSATAIAHTLGEVARVINDERPDLVLLQEVDDGASRTDKEDQLARLLPLLGGRYPCHTSAFYWKGAFVPHPRIMGAVGMKLSTLSRYRIDRSTRYQLAQMPEGFLKRLFGLKRAVLEADLPLQGGGRFAVLNTHLDAFAQGFDTMQRQVRQVKALLDGLTKQRVPWVIGGDFNLLPGPRSYARLAPGQRPSYNPRTELTPLLKRYRSFPSLAQAEGPDAARWFTHFPNDPAVKQPDRTIDYVFFSDDVTLGAHRVRQSDTRKISDHFPVIVEVTLPAPAR